MKYLTVNVKTITEMLGTCSNNKEIYTEFIASKAPGGVTRTDELEMITEDEYIEKTTTVYPKKDGVPYIFDYQIKGFLKDACSALRRMKGEERAKESLKLTAYKKVIDGCIFVYPRMIKINSPGEITLKQRPLRGQTAQGERISIACSEQLPEGCTMTFSIECPDIYEAFVRECLEYGRYKGFLQWRNAGFGRFEYSIEEDAD